ncbi:MAG: CocE/NonD family hydrolase, partial [Caulobacteraceae bacterium]|nr:CocE/NonD family hydrolase [Caulobacteraceae bacterium]
MRKRKLASSAGVRALARKSAMLAGLSATASLVLAVSVSAPSRADETPASAAATAHGGPSYSGEAPQAAAAAAHPDYVRTSQYVAVRDGAKLAIDILHPAQNGVMIAGRLPVVLIATPYQRAMVVGGRLMTQAEMNKTYAALLKAGYVVAALDIRGRGASFGDQLAPGHVAADDTNRLDLYDVIEWLAVQPWSSGAIGMSGCSYVGNTVHWAASAMPPHLKAIAPCAAPIDSYASVMRPGGVNQTGFLAQWDSLMRQQLSVGVPVDDDRDGAVLKSVVDHRVQWLAAHPYDLIKAREAQPFRDSKTPEATTAYEWNYAPNYAITNMPVLQFGGWRDLFPQDTLRWRETLAAEGLPLRLVIGPWWHCQWYDADPQTAAEHIRWYDRYLKGIDNGVDRQPSIRYYVMGAPAGHEWREASQWPIPGIAKADFYLGGGRSGSAASVNDGSLARRAAEQGGADAYKVDYGVTTTGLSTRWNIPRGAPPQLDTAAIDAKSLTYTSAPFTEGAEFTGFPVLSLWMASSVPNPDFYFYLSVVDPDGKTTLMTDGQLRAANRTVRRPPWPDVDHVPWQGAFAGDNAPLTPGQPAKIDLALYPVSFYVKPGQRVRLTINDFDKGNFDTPVEASPPTITILRD